MPFVHLSCVAGTDVPQKIRLAVAFDGNLKANRLASAATASATVPLTSGRYYGKADECIRALDAMGKASLQDFLEVTAADAAAAAAAAAATSAGAHMQPSVFLVCRVMANIVCINEMRLYLQPCIEYSLLFLCL